MVITITLIALMVEIISTAVSFEDPPSTEEYRVRCWCMNGDDGILTHQNSSG